MSLVFNHAGAETHDELVARYMTENIKAQSQLNQVVSTDSSAMAGITMVGLPRHLGNLDKLTHEVRGRTLITQSEISKRIVEFSECDVPPAFATRPKPVYPEQARIKEISGNVFVRVLIDEQGRVVKTGIVKRVPADTNVFDKVAMDYIMSARFSPGEQNGKKVKVWMTIPVRFLLQDKTKSPEQGATQQEIVR